VPVGDPPTGTESDNLIVERESSAQCSPQSSSGQWPCTGGLTVPPATPRQPIDDRTAKGDDSNRSIDQIEEAVNRGVPFRLKVADGDEFRVPHADYIFVKDNMG